MQDLNVTCIGGGHGLGHLLEIINDFESINVTGIVITTDNGGSTGRLRENCDTISWGDIRYCLSKLSKKVTTKQHVTAALLFEYRFDNLGDLSGHSLGNLMFCAIDSLCMRPTEAVKVMQEYLGIETNILPMSDHVTQLISYSGDLCHVGEVAVDDYAVQGITKLELAPKVKPSEEVLDALKNTDVLFLGPGSFYTSTLPSLLMSDVIDSINSNNKLKIYYIANVESEFNLNQGGVDTYDEIHNQLEFIKGLGLTKTIHSLIPSHRLYPSINLCEPYTIADLPADSSGKHHERYYRDQLVEVLKFN